MSVKLTSLRDLGLVLKQFVKGDGNDLDASKLLQTNANGQVVSLDSPTLAEVAFLSGATSNIQTQLDEHVVKVKSFYRGYLASDQNYYSAGYDVEWTDSDDADGWTNASPDSTIVVPSGLGITDTLILGSYIITMSGVGTFSRGLLSFDGVFTAFGTGGGAHGRQEHTYLIQRTPFIGWDAAGEGTVIRLNMDTDHGSATFDQVWGGVNDTFIMCFGLEVG